MMDLTVEIQGDATSLEECLEQFTAKEWLHGENMYKCDGYELSVCVYIAFPYELRCTGAYTVAVFC